MTAFAGVEIALHDYLTVELAGPRVCTELPADLAGQVPLVQVVRIGGPHSGEDPYIQVPTVSVDTFAGDRASATDLSHQVDLALRRITGTTVHGARFGIVRTLSGPAWRPWDDTSVRRFGATYSLWMRALTA